MKLDIRLCVKQVVLTMEILQTASKKSRDQIDNSASQ